MADCPFCQRIAGGDYDDRSADHDAVHFGPLNPVTPGHRLVVPVGHVVDALQDPYVTGSTMAYAARVAELLKLHPCNLITSVGAAATQSVYHLHIHIVPRRYGDGLALPWSESREVVAAAVAAERERIATALAKRARELAARARDELAGSSSGYSVAALDLLMGSRGLNEAALAVRTDIDA